MATDIECIIWNNFASKQQQNKNIILWNRDLKNEAPYVQFQNKILLKSKSIN